jgi:hypothetical protein
VISVMLALALARPAQDSGLQDSSPQDGRRLAVYLVTFSPGPRVWERFGHNAIWIRDTLTGQNVAYDYGRFSFDEARFFIGFARGRMLYWMGREDGVALINFYVRRQRSAWLQQLDLSTDQRVRLREILERNYEHDRGRYRYDYYRNNCSTRLRDAIDSVVGGAIRTTLNTGLTPTTYRWHTRRSLQSNPIDYFAIDAGLGPVTDLPITRYQEAFLPEKLREHLRSVNITGRGGEPVPLVKREIAVAETDLFPVPERPSNWTAQFTVVGLALGGVLFTLGRRGRSSFWSRVGFGWLAGLWAVVAALGGGVLVFLAFFSEHVVAFKNENLWQFNLLAVALLPLLPGALRRRSGRVKPALALAWMVAAGSLIGLGLKLLPAFAQSNGEIIGLTLPLHLGLAAGLTAAVRSQSPAPSSTPPSPR